jgi:hypothetical protein
MSIKFHNNIYLKTEKGWFLWEPAWGMYRPIEKLAWNGTSFKQVFDKKFLTITDEFYGFGSKEMYKYCENLGEPKESKEAYVYIGKNPEWWYDRPVVFAECTNKERVSWKKMVGKLRHNTHRNKQKIHFTRRNK